MATAIHWIVWEVGNKTIQRTQYYLDFELYINLQSVFIPNHITRTMRFWAIYAHVRVRSLCLTSRYIFASYSLYGTPPYSVKYADSFIFTFVLSEGITRRNISVWLFFSRVIHTTYFWESWSNNFGRSLL